MGNFRRGNRRTFLKTMGAAALATGMPRPTDAGAAANNLEDVEASVKWTQAFLATL